MKHGIMELVPVLVTFMVVAIVVFYVVLPVVNAQLMNASTQPANLTGYTGAWTVASQIPLLLVVTLIVTVAAIIMFALGTRND